MEPPSTIWILGMLGFALLGAALSAVDGGLTALGEYQLKAIVAEENKLRNAALRVLEKRRYLHIRYLTGRVSCIVGMATCTAYLLQPVSSSSISLCAIVGVSFFYTATAETITSVIRRRGIFLALRMTQWLRPFELILTPLSMPIMWLSRGIEKFVPENRTRPIEDITDLAVEHLIEEGEEKGAILEDQAELLRSVLEFRNTIAREVMVPRTQMIAVDVSTPIEQALSLVLESGHSRYPLFKERIDQIEGVFYVKDLFKALQSKSLHNRTENNRVIELADIMRKSVFFAPETQKVGALLKEMQSKRIHMAIVVDEFGGTSGLVTLEDILEEIVGEIQDEHEKPDSSIKKIGPAHFVLDADVSVYDLEELIDEKLPETDGNYDSVGGMVTELAERVPEKGFEIQIGAFDFKVTQANEKHIQKVEIKKTATQEVPSVNEPS